MDRHAASEPAKEFEKSHVRATHVRNISIHDLLINQSLSSKTAFEEQTVKPPSDSSPEYSLDTLNLLVPWDIPLECKLTEPIKQQIQTGLRSLTQALNNPNCAQALKDINQALTILPKSKSYLAQSDKTKTALSIAAVEEYDTYFKISHVQTNSDEDTALCLTRGLITNCHCFISLCHRVPSLSPTQIEQQKRGFHSYIALLSRAFDISPLL